MLPIEFLFPSCTHYVLATVFSLKWFASYDFLVILTLIESCLHSTTWVYFGPGRVILAAAAHSHAKTLPLALSHPPMSATSMTALESPIHSFRGPMNLLRVRTHIWREVAPPYFKPVPRIRGGGVRSGCVWGGGVRGNSGIGI